MNETSVRDMFQTVVSDAPDGYADIDRMVEGGKRIRRRRRTRTLAISAMASLAVVGVLAVATVNRGTPPTVASPSPSWSVPTGLAGQPITVDEGTASCAYEYSPERIATTLDFAVDGTVVSVGDSLPQLPNVAQKAGYAGVTLRVNEWFKGDTGSATLTVNAPAPGTSSIDGFGSPTEYAPGTRLLVSGMIADEGAPVAYAWFGCGGFSRYYGDAVAAQWRTAMKP